MPEAIIGLFVFVPLIMYNRAFLRNHRKKRFYPDKTKPTLSISEKEMILRGHRYKWPEIFAITISNDGTYISRGIFTPKGKIGGCECAHIQLNNKIELLLDMGYNFHDKDKTRIIELFKKYCKNVDTQ